jgi:hypothetical protein
VVYIASPNATNWECLRWNTEPTQSRDTPWRPRPLRRKRSSTPGLFWEF